MEAKREAPIRVLHVLGSLNRGGVETWLMHVLRHMDRSLIRSDFLVHTEKPGVLDEEARGYGAEIIPCLAPSRPLEYSRCFRRVLREHGGYDVVHSHVHHFSGYTLRIARQEGVKVRIAHSHSDTSSVQQTANMGRRAYLGVMHRWLVAHPTVRFAVSLKAAHALYGTSWGKEGRDHILYYGIDLDRFEEHVDRAAIRRQLGIPEDAFVVGHVGRFTEVKNHAFLIDIFTDLAARDRNAVLLLVGVGHLQADIKALAETRGIGDRVIFAGARSDVPRVMKGAMDAFVLPSFFEGLPVVGIEAQAAGLPCVFADTITREVALIPGLTQYLSLSESPSVWSQTIATLKETNPRQQSTVNHLRGGPFDIQKTIQDLATYYAGGGSAEPGQ